MKIHEVYITYIQLILSKCSHFNDILMNSLNVLNFEFSCNTLLKLQWITISSRFLSVHYQVVIFFSPKCMNLFYCFMIIEVS